MSPSSKPSFISRITGSLPGRVVGAYGESQAGNYASGLAFNAFMTMFPLILGVLSIVGLAIHDYNTQRSIQESLLAVFPSDAHQEINAALTGVRDSAGLLGIISILGLIWAGTNFFAAMEFALNQVVGAKQRNFVRQRLMGLCMMVMLVVTVVITVGANAVMNLVPFMAALGPVVAAASMFVLMMSIYRFVPNRTMKIPEIWQGALLAAVLSEVITLVFPLYGRLVHGFNGYGAQFALFFLLATWLAFLSQFIMLGSLWNKVRLGATDTGGLIATPRGEGRNVPLPAEAADRASR